MQSFVTNSWGESYCAKHQGELPECYSCRRLVCQALTGGGKHYSDGRYICNVCLGAAITDVNDGKVILGKVCRALTRMGMSLDVDVLPLRLVDEITILHTSISLSRITHVPTGVTETRFWTQGGNIIRQEVKQILILHSLPLEHFAAVAAHELCHAWLFLNAFPKLPQEVEEGLCELSAYLWLWQQQTPVAAFHRHLIEQNPDPIYGRGFQAARHSLSSLPFSLLLAFVRDHQRFP